MIRSFNTLLAVVILTACTSNSGPQLPNADFFVSTGQDFGLRVGETAGIVTSTSIGLVRFNGVLSDSRCPANVTCVTAGFATTLLTVQSALNVQDITVDVPPLGTVEQQVEELTVVVIGVRPDALDGVRIDPLSYIVGIRVLETGTLPLPQ